MVTLLSSVVTVSAKVHTIGEYAAMTRIESVKFKNLGFFQDKKGLKTLDDLKAEMDKSR